MLVGREDELRRLRRALDEATAGVGRLVLISGEAGVGKTRLALEALGEAERLGALTAVGACWDGAGTPGLWPWVQVLRTFRDRRAKDGDATVRGLDQLLDTGEPRTSDHFHVFEATLQLFSDVCQDHPAVVLLDDLQWADPASLSLVDFLHRHAVHLRLLMLGTYRSDEVTPPGDPGPDRLRDLSQKALSVPLRGLDNDAIGALREELGAPTTTAEAEHLRRLTGGNPFFVIESVAYRDPAESLGVRRAMDRRVDALGDAEREALITASLIGREAPTAVLDAVLEGGRAFEAVVDAVEQSGLARLEDDQLVFVHDLVRETLRARLPPDDCRHRFAHIVEAVQRAGLTGLLLPAQLAWMAARAVPDLPSASAVALLEAAAEDAKARLAYEAAGAHFADAAALTDDRQQCARLTLASADALQRAGELARARVTYTNLVEESDVSTRARALLGLQRLGDPAATDEPSDLVRRLDAVDAELDATSDQALHAAIRAARSRARSHLLSEDRTAAAPMAADALTLARQSRDEATIATCLLAYHDAIWEPGTEDTRRGLAEELTGIGHRLQDPSVEADGLLLRMVTELERGDPRYLHTHHQFDSLATTSGLPRLQFVATSRRGTVATMRADMALARTEIDAARALGERIADPDAVGMWCDQRWQVARHTGDDGAIDELLRTLREGGDPHWMVYAALVSVRNGDPDGATRLLPEVISLGERWPRWAARLWDTFLVEVVALEQNPTRIADLVARLEPDAANWAVLGGGVLVHGPMSLWLGRLEAAREDWSRARAWAEAAEVAARRLDATVWVLEARGDRLAAERALGTVDGREIASTIDAARELDLHPLARRLEVLAPAATDVSPNVFRRDHDVWTIVFDGIEIRVPDAKGLRDLHVLLRHANVEVPATALATDAPAVAGASDTMLDARAKAEYRRRLDDIDRELDNADRRGDAGRGARLEAERDALLAELRVASGLGGRDRQLGDDRERLRKTVTARIRDTLRRLDARHPALGAHLNASIRTGAICVYAPPHPVRWDL